MWASSGAADGCLHLQPAGLGPQCWEGDPVRGARVVKDWESGEEPGKRQSLGSAL